MSVTLIACAAIVGCGKKGPPLAPIVHVPAAVDKLTAQRVGDDIYLSVTIPTQNIDASTPADVSRIDIFGVTSLTPPPRARIFEIASRVASIDVQPAPRPGDRNAAPPAPDAATSTLPAQGATVTVRDALTPTELVPKELPAAPTRGLTTTATVTAPAAASPFPRRYYIAVAQSDRGRVGPPGTLLDVPLPPLPDPPIPILPFAYTPDAVIVAWEPSGGVLGFLFEKAAPIEPSPVDDVAGAGPATPPVAVPTGPVLYNVYREPSSGEAASAAAVTRQAAPPAPINPAPLAGLTFEDSADMQLGRERCYTVRAVRGAAPNLVIGAASPRACFTPEDRFAPEPPTNLSAIAEDGGISLLWDPNGEADLGGYLILRGRAGDATLQPLTVAPVMDTHYADRDVMPGVRYVYAVTAVDTHMNVSTESNRVEETAR